MPDPEHRERKRGVRWNESNLAENEIVRAEIRQQMGVPIDEPKTPFHYDQEDGDDAGDIDNGTGDVDDTDNAAEIGIVGGERNGTGGTGESLVDDDSGNVDEDRDEDGTARERSALGASASCIHKRSRRGHTPGDLAATNEPMNTHVASDTRSELGDQGARRDDDQRIAALPRDPRRARTAFDEAMEVEERERRDEEIARAEKKKAFEEARKRHYGNAGLGMRLGNLLAEKGDDSNEEDDCVDDASA